MCGLVGLVHAYSADARFDPAPLRSASEALRAWSPSDSRAADALYALASAIDEASLALVGWAGFRTLRESPELQAETAALGAALAEAADALEQRLNAPDGVRSARDAESFSRASVAARDVSWRILRDALPNLRTTAELAPEGEKVPPKGWFELWRLNLVLNQLARLEVRGRDSGGLAVLVALPATAWEEFSASLGPELAGELEHRRALASLRDGAVLVTEGATTAVAFARKVAREVGELGANVRELREKLRGDALLRSVLFHPEAEAQVLAHTRWASNGVISEPNCHPVANDLRGAPPERLVLGALNGDVDNYPALARGWDLPLDCTTDAKVVPLEVARYLARGLAPTEAVRAAARTLQGSTAIGVLLGEDPRAAHLALRGSGQALYVGSSPEGGALYASELYGVVEYAARYYKLDGEEGEVVRLAAGDTPRVLRYSGEAKTLAAEQLKTAPIATRDIDRGGFEHYFVKEVNDAPRSVERTLCGKFRCDEAGPVRFLLGDEVVPPMLRDRLRSGALRKVFVIGQGTAAVAGRAAADFMGTLLTSAGVSVRGMPATELSGFHLGRLGPDSLVVAVSQSGTTTDTNRTVDLARTRGAHVLAIVNRRGSDLVDKSHGVLYTSDGRDVEMSVASTKAFYCQVVAGYLLGLQLAHLAGALSEEDLRGHLLRLQDLPRCLREVLGRGRERIRHAAGLALRRSHWTVVGSGPSAQAAREVRIKLSELCYKSVSVDTIEDKKHIDLSSEPLILVCAAGLGGPAAADAVKEVAIFKAHAAIPVVICDRGETRFAEYAAATIPVPPTTPELALLLNTAAGHLFSYEAARAIDARADLLRRLRDVVDAAASAFLAARRAGSGAEVRDVVQRFRAALRPLTAEVEATVAAGDWNAAVPVDEALSLLASLRGWLEGAGASDASPADPPLAERFEALQGQIGRVLDALRRPIDAIKHQAKTVTVGISREAAAIRPPAGKLLRALVACGAPEGSVSDQDAAALSGLDPAVSACLGAVRYDLRGLSPLGIPTEESTIVVAQKTGVAEKLSSRAEGPAGVLLSGTKRMVARAPRVWAGHGRRDGRSLLMCPLYTDGVLSGLGLLHVRFHEALDTAARIRALRALGRYEDLVCAVTEYDLPWDDALLDSVAVDELLTSSPERLAEVICARTGREATSPSGGTR